MMDRYDGSPRRRCVVRITAAIALTLAIGATTSVTGRAASPASGAPVTFSCTGAPQSYVVPPGVMLLWADVRGGFGAQAEDSNGGLGGRGGRVLSPMSVTPGVTLTVYVGCGGQGRTGGWGHGVGGEGGSSGTFASNGGGGGGSSAIVANGSPLVVAGGGGGGGGNSSTGGSRLGGAGGAGTNPPEDGADGLCNLNSPGCTPARGGCAGCAATADGGAGDEERGLFAGGGGAGGGGFPGGNGGQASTIDVFGDIGNAGGGGGGQSYAVDPGAVFLASSTGPDGSVTIGAAVPAVQVFTCAQGPTSFVVPPGVTSLTVEATGGSGVSPGASPSGNKSGAGGLGGLVVATIPVTSGTTYSVIAGCQGAGRDGGSGVGSGGPRGAGNTSDGKDGGSGGGGSGLTLAGAAAPVVVAGGGGGGGGAGGDVLGATGGAGGNGGTLGTTAGSDASGPDAGPGGCETCGSGGDGGAATDGAGGISASGGGGGGGGGAQGGGGGHGSSGSGGGGGGAGGISAVASSATDVVIGAATAPGDGLVVLMYSALPAIVSGPPPPGAIGVLYAFTVMATGSPAPVFGIAAGNLPPGLALDAASGAITGTPTAVGTYAFTVMAENGAGTPAVAPYTVTINQPPVITSPSPPFQAQVGQPYAFTVTASGVPPVSFGLSGGLPPGLSLDATSGLISGTPTAAGSDQTYAFQILALNGVNPFDESPVYNIGVYPANLTPAPLTKPMTGKAQSVGAGDRGHVRIEWRFGWGAPIPIDRATVIVKDVLAESSGRELVRRAGGTRAVPLVLHARPGGKATSAIFETPASERTKIRVEIKTRDARKGLVDFAITIDRADILQPAACASGSATAAPLTTTFTVHVPGSGVLVGTTQPWRCHGQELRTP